MQGCPQNTREQLLNTASKLGVVLLETLESTKEACSVLQEVASGKEKKLLIKCWREQ